MEKQNHVTAIHKKKEESERRRSQSHSPHSRTVVTSEGSCDESEHDMRRPLNLPLEEIKRGGGRSERKESPGHRVGSVNVNGPPPPLSRLAPQGLMNNLPYMGELTFDTRPRRGRKPKKADICHLISKNYGIQFPNSYVNQPNSSLTTPPTKFPPKTGGGSGPRRKTHRQRQTVGVSEGGPKTNFPWNFLPELIRSGSSGSGVSAPSSSHTSSQISSKGSVGLIFPPSITLTPIRTLVDEPLNLCLRDSSDDPHIQTPPPSFTFINTSGKKTGRGGPRPGVLPSSRTRQTPTAGGRDSSLVNSIKQNTKKRESSGGGACWGAHPQSGGRGASSAAKARERSSSAAAAAAVAAANSAEVSICKFKFTGGAKPSLQEKKMLSVDSGGNFRFFTDKPSSCGGGGKSGVGGSANAHREELSHQFSSDSTMLPKSAKSMSMCMMPSMMNASTSPPSVSSPHPDSSHSHDDVTSEPMDFKEENLSPSPFLHSTGGATSNTSNSSDSNNSNTPPPRPSSKTPPQMGVGMGGLKMKVKRKRRTRKSLVREKLEKTFKEKGFLIQTQQLESAEGATYCKFRQLRKFTRYLFRSWKDYLPDTVKEIGGGSGGSSGVGTNSTATICPPGDSSTSEGQNDHTKESVETELGGGPSPSPERSPVLIKCERKDTHPDIT